MLVTYVSIRSNVFVSGKRKEHLSFYFVSDGCSCVCPHAAIMVGVWLCFLTLHGTSGSKEERSLIKEDAGSTLVPVIFSVPSWKCFKTTVTFDPWTTEKNHLHHAMRSTLSSQKQLKEAASPFFTCTMRRQIVQHRTLVFSYLKFYV